MRQPRPRYLPLIEAEPGMVLGSPVKLMNHGVMVYSLPGGHVLTEDNLHQLSVRHCESLFVVEPEVRSDAQIAIETAAAARRVMEIFATADLQDPLMAAFFDQVLLHRSA